ncbi:MAG: YfjI family protein [Chloroflexota bacterium]|nr:YfjI family protein [Chloroflexota bacterium]
MSTATRPTAASPALDTFRFVDTAIGGAHNRNHVCAFADFQPPAAARDVFTTYLRFPDSLPAYLATNRNNKGQPSVSGYAGTAYAPRVVFDFDCAGDLAAAHRDAQAFAHVLSDAYDVPPGALHIAFSGAKGFSFELPGTLFGEFAPAPAPELAARFKHLAVALADHMSTLDVSIYDPVRLWRWLNTINGKSGLYKIALTVTELLTLDVDAIRRLAAQPRDFASAPDDEWSTIPDLAGLWHATAQPEPARQGTTPGPSVGTDTLSADQLSAATAILEPAYVEGQRHELTKALAGWLAKQDYAKASAIALIERLAVDDPELPGRRRNVETTYQKYAAGEVVTGWDRLTDLVPDRALKTLEVFLGTEPRMVTAAHRAGRNGASGAADRGDEAAPAAKREPNWPQLDPGALYGLAGDVARAIDPHTESDLAATLANILIMAGSAIGPTPHVLVGDRRHHGNESVVLVGATSKARKGTSHDTPEAIVREADPGWATRVQGGVSSGEGIIWAVRDPIEEEKKGEITIVDPGEPDKRLLLVEEEYAAVLKVAAREGNTVSEIIRRAWDGKPLHILTKNRRARCQSPHISMLAHITKTELQRELTDVSAGNGFGNRYLWLCVRRSKILPEGGRLPDDERVELVRRTREAIIAARKITTVERDTEAKALWAEVYPDLSEAGTGLWGALTDRAEAHVLRLSLLYALLECSAVITADHLTAALCLWDYCAASAKYLFGDATGDPIADRILTALRANGPMAQGEIGDLLGRNVNAGRLGKAFETLLAAKLACSAREHDEERKGRPRTVWTAI